MNDRLTWFSVNCLFPSQTSMPMLMLSRSWPFVRQFIDTDTDTDTNDATQLLSCLVYSIIYIVGKNLDKILLLIFCTIFQRVIKIYLKYTKNRAANETIFKTEIEMNCFNQTRQISSRFQLAQFKDEVYTPLNPNLV